MKNKYILMLLLIIFIIFGCTVNAGTGLIKIENQTTEELKNVRVGGALIANSVMPGGSYYYWYFDTISGKVNADNMDVFSGFDKKWEFEVDYWINITASIVETGNGEEACLFVAKDRHGAD